MLVPEEAVDEGVQEEVVVTEEDADREEPGGAKSGVDAVGGVEASLHDIGRSQLSKGSGGSHWQGSSGSIRESVQECKGGELRAMVARAGAGPGRPP